MKQSKIGSTVYKITDPEQWTGGGEEEEALILLCLALFVIYTSAK